MLKKRDLIVIKPTDDSNDVTNNVSRAIQNGLPVLLENAGENIGSAIESVLEQSKKKEGGIEMMKFLDKFYTFDKNFQFFITTKLANPHYPPEICA